MFNFSCETMDGTKEAEFFKIIRVVQEADAEYMARPTFTGPKDCARFIQSKIGDAAFEQFGLILLDTKHRPVGWMIAHQGCLDQCPVYPQTIFVPALVSGAKAIILFHNHPSGDPTASHPDIKLTERLAKAGDLLGIQILDHIIIGEGDNFSSLKELGIL